MSTLAFAALTTRRERGSAQPPAPGTPASGAGSANQQHYVDVLAALVPGEVLAMHAVILTYTIGRNGETAGAEQNNTAPQARNKTNAVALPNKTTAATEITAPQTLFWSFWGLVVLAALFYIVPRFRVWKRLDFLRAAVPPIAFVAWTMIQPATAFDAVWPQLSSPARTVIALFVAVILGSLVKMAAKAANQNSSVQ